MVAYVATTRNVTVTVRPGYLDRHSDFAERRFVFGYYVQIRNDGPEDVQLLRRHWIIQEKAGRSEEVEGEGVIGKQPVIRPGEVHEYSSFCVLQSLEGTMEGSYLMQSAGGDTFRATIPLFHLRVNAN